jgi:hypothetical protein
LAKIYTMLTTTARPPTIANVATSQLYRPALKLAIVGPGRSGKDTAAEWFAARHDRRAIMRAKGDAMRESDPAALAREALKFGDIANGIRAKVEIEAVKLEGLVDLTIWIDREVERDDTLEFGPEVADIIIQNHGGLADFHARLARLARSWGVLR